MNEFWDFDVILIYYLFYLGVGWLRKDGFGWKDFYFYQKDRGFL